ncbi:hypothetical protein F1649_15710 [Arcticibacter tournemirensis]|uniref:Uncharacterized protein n=2 Tax=Arcticibacter tournemirensis TaxID=699437 RepID=A0A5M9H4K9_9SPHI|nr:hypothetical protein F1649_15710 [Arcticibacter tournemirensis]
MKTTVINSSKGNGKINTTIGNDTPGKIAEATVNGLPVNTGFDKKEAEPEAPETIADAAIPASTPAELATPETKQEPTKKELKEEMKAVPNLENTLKLVEELHRRKVQRDRLLATINSLESFEIAQKEDAEETDSNYYQGCQLTIEDDNRNKFSTKNPVIIQAVAQFVNHMCVNRLAEIEAGIVIP